LTLRQTVSRQDKATLIDEKVKWEIEKS
jgi:hypothetical protein